MNNGGHQLPRDERRPLQYDRAARGGALVEFEIRSGRAIVTFPPNCCQCLNLTTNRRRLTGLSSVDVRVPICEACERVWRGRRRRIAAVGVTAIALALALATLWAFARPGSLLEAVAVGAPAFVLGLIAIGLVVHFFGLVPAPLRERVCNRSVPQRRVRAPPPVGWGTGTGGRPFLPTACRFTEAGRRRTANVGPLAARQGSRASSAVADRLRSESRARRPCHLWGRRPC